MRAHFCTRIFLVLLTLVPCVALRAQLTADANLIGVVKDTSDAMIANAQVKLESLGTGAVRETRTNGEGFYRFDLIAPGDYRVTITSPGFQTQVMDRLA